uniref:Uncharacterized protein LOC104226561 n=1 Tax=Nicotiana sylvestris TaxID=4096 RepID=A0A1U7WE03_NICSY|nr:PREDICTED: uncharacterized protein LOC104226561 [Nicotiana sylvestris]
MAAAEAVKEAIWLKGLVAELSLHVEFEPSTYSQAASIPAWQDAMRKEFEALEANHTWDIVELPKGKKPIVCKWVYKVKYKADGSVERYKARLVIRGDTQVEDVNNAFLHGDLDEEVYMKLPHGLSVSGCSSSAPPVRKLQKSLYGLRQASRQWYVKLSQALCSKDFSPSVNDYSLFVKGSPGSLTILAVYVDDIILTGDNAFVSDLLSAYHFSDVSSVVCPLELHDKLSVDSGDILDNLEAYRSLIVIGIGLLALIPDALSLSFVFFLGDSLISWKSKKQPIMSLSSAEVKYRAISKVVAELTWLVRIFSDLHVPVSLPISVFCDNQAAIHIAKNPIFHERTKHIEMYCYFIRAKLADGLIYLSHVSTLKQFTDVLTKPLTG